MKIKIRYTSILENESVFPLEYISQYLVIDLSYTNKQLLIFSNKSIILREQFPIIDRVTVYIHTYTGITYIGHVYNFKKKRFTLTMCLLTR